MFRYEMIYEFIKEECRKQYVLGAIEGLDAKTVADNFGMHRTNVVNEFKKLIEMNLIYKRNGRPVLYYVDLSTIEYEIKSQKDKESIYNNIDKYLEFKTNTLVSKGFNNKEIKSTITKEIGNYISGFLDVIENKVQISKEELSDIEYVIGVESDGKKTKAIAYNRDGKEIAHGESGFGNIVINKEEGLKNIEIAILKCLRNLDEEKCVHIYGGLPGVDTGNNKEIIKRYLEERFPISITIMNDAEITLYSALKGKNGILVMSGLGSIVYSKNENEKFRIGGYGPLLGDKGSIYYIVIETIKEIVKEKDLRQDFSTLSQRIINFLEVKEIGEIVQIVYSDKRGSLVNIFPIIAEEAETGNEVALNILKSAGKYLGECAYKAYKFLDNQEEVNIALKGDLINDVSIVKESFIEEIDKYIKNYKLFKTEVSSAKGAYYIEISK